MNIDKKSQVFSDYSDTHKMVHGFRPRLDWTKLTLEQLTEMLRDLYEFADQEFLREEKEHQKSWKAFRNMLQSLSNDSLVSITTVLNWIFSEYEDDGYGTQLRDIIRDYNLGYDKETVLYRVLRKGGYVEASDFPINNFKN